VKSVERKWLFLSLVAIVERISVMSIGYQKTTIVQINLSARGLLELDLIFFRRLITPNWKAVNQQVPFNSIKF
jgi:hypothetical protein